jgi:ferredoxin
MNDSISQHSLSDNPAREPSGNSAHKPSDNPARKPFVSEQIVGKYHVKVINEKCIGAASCVALAPGTFAMNEENIAEVISQTGDPDDMKLLGAQSCPTAAIIVTDTETGKQVWPVEEAEY